MPPRLRIPQIFAEPSSPFLRQSRPVANNPHPGYSRHTRRMRHFRRMCKLYFSAGRSYRQSQRTARVSARIARESIDGCACGASSCLSWHSSWLHHRYGPKTPLRSSSLPASRCSPASPAIQAPAAGSKPIGCGRRGPGCGAIRGTSSTAPTPPVSAICPRFPATTATACRADFAAAIGFSRVSTPTSVTGNRR